jgi:V-type H+-transporting ATPase subunit C
METVWLCTVPNVDGSSSGQSLGSIKRATSRDSKTCEFYSIDIPPLHHGTLDSLIALSDELNKLGPAVENMMKKVERQYFDIQEAARKKAQPLKVQEKSVEAYLHNWEWDYARYQHQGKKLANLVSQISSQSSTADEELKKLLASHAERTTALAAWQRKKVVNLGTSDFEDFLTLEQGRALEVLDNDHLLTLMVSMPKHTEDDFLKNYCSKGDSAGWSNMLDIASYGDNGNRDAVKGSPIVPGSAKLVVEIEGQCLYAVTILKGHSLSGHLDEATSVFTPGATVDYIEPCKRAFRDHRCTARHFTMDLSKDVSVDSQIDKCQAEWNASASTVARWSAAHFGDILSAYIHLKVISAYVESVLRYGVPVDICTFFVVPFAGLLSECQASLSSAIIEERPHLVDELCDDLDEEVDDSGHLPFVLQTFSICTGTGETH